MTQRVPHSGLLLAFGFLVLGCGDNEVSIAGTEARVFVADDVSQVPVNLESSKIQGCQYDGGDWQCHDGRGNADGEFEVVVGAGGPWTLSVGARHVYLTESDVGRPVEFRSLMGRRESATPASGQTELSLSYEGLVDWQSDDEVFLFSPDAGVNLVVFDYSSTPRPILGETLLDATIDYSLLGYEEYLIESGMGDSAYLIQMRDAVTSFGPEVSVVAMADVVVDQVQGQAAAATGDFFAPSSELTVRSELDAPGWAQLAGGADHGVYFAIFASRPGGAHVFLEPAVWLYTLVSGRETEIAPVGVDLPGLFDTDWFWVEEGVTYWVDVGLRDSVPEQFVGGSIARWRPALETGAAEPLPLPATTIDGVDLMDVQQMSSTPEIEVRGELDSLRVDLIHLRLDDTGTVTLKETVAAVSTSGSSLRLPPGVLQAGEYYVLSVTVERWRSSSFVQQATAVSSVPIVVNP